MIIRYVIGATIGAIIGLIMGYLGSHEENTVITTNLWLGALIGMGVGIFITLLSSSSVDIDGIADKKGNHGSFG